MSADCSLGHLRRCNLEISEEGKEGGEGEREGRREVAGLVPVPSPRLLLVWVAKPNGESLSQRESTVLEAEQSTSVGHLRWGWGGGRLGGVFAP